MSPERIVAQTYLGDNTVAILAALVAHMSLRTGLDVQAEVGPPGSSPDAAVHAQEFDLVWACGLMTRELIAGGRLEADIVAAPVFAGESAAVYHSVVVARPARTFASLADAMSGRLAINEEQSWSGHHGLLTHMRQSGWHEFVGLVWSGSHKKSAEAVLAGRADVAAIDSTVWEHLLTSDPALGELEVIDRTADWPAPPFSIRRSLDPELRAQLVAALTSIGPGDIDGLERVEPASTSTYATMRRVE